MQRRSFFRNGVLASGAILTGSDAFSVETNSDTQPKIENTPFKLNYSIHDGMFRNNAGDDFLQQIQFAYDQGFRSIEDNGMRGREPAMQEKIGNLLARLGMDMGVFVAHNIDWNKPTLTSPDKSLQEKFLKEIKESVEVAKRCHAKWMTVVPGVCSNNININFQSATVVETLKKASEILEPHGLVMVLEPLNFRDHPNLFLVDVPQAYLICKAVGSPSCKILYDLYHAQIQIGNLIPFIDQAWDETAYFQIGDNPGRKEPTTGEINYKNIFKHIHSKNFKGLLGMEHGNMYPGKEGELKLIQAYREVDSF
jgi:hydroxypyruvate isomerase